MSGAAESVFEVPRIRCEGCAGAIRDALGQAEGVTEVSVEVETRRVRVAYDPSALDEAGVRALLEEAGYPSAP
jgi:copper chaperone CopZ